MGQKYILETEGFYRSGHYYKPGEPFEMAAGMRPPSRAIPCEQYTRPEAQEEPKPALSELGRVEKASKRKD
jgi:hypothetical protein